MGRAANIGPKGVRRRRISGYVWYAIAGTSAVAGLAADASPLLLALLVIPFSLGALGLLQAREKT